MDKRSVLTVGKELAIAFEIDGASRHDSKLLERTLDNVIFRPALTHRR